MNQSPQGRHVILSRGETRQEFSVPSAEAWDSVVSVLIKSLKPGDILALSGPLGAGKTTFTQALAKGLGIAKSPQSPTFSLLRTYALPVPMKGIERLIHVDAYRIEDEKEILPLDLDEELSDDASVLVLEWPENVKGWLAMREPILLKIQHEKPV